MECSYCGSLDLVEEFFYTNPEDQTLNNINIRKKKLHSCQKCNLIFCSNITAKELDDYYRKYENLYEDEKTKNRIKDSHWAPFNSRFFSQFLYFLQYANRDNINSVLEIGPNWQGILPTIKYFKKDVKYFFFDQTNSKSMQENGGVQLGTYFDPELANLPSVDLVWMSHSLEHIHPKLLKPTLKKIYDSLNPGGYFFIEIPDNVKEKIFTFPHTLFFDQRTLLNILEKQGFKIISSQSIEKTKIKDKKMELNTHPILKKNYLVDKFKKIIKSLLTRKFKQKLLVNYAVKNLNGPYSERPNIRIIVTK